MAQDLSNKPRQTGKTPVCQLKENIMGFFSFKKREPTALVPDTDPKAPTLEHLFLTGALGINKQGGAAYARDDFGKCRPRVVAGNGANNPAGWLMRDSYYPGLDHLQYGRVRDDAMIAEILRSGLNISDDRLYGSKRRDLILAMCHLHDLWFEVTPEGEYSRKLISDHKRILRDHFSQFARSDDKAFLQYWELACMSIACNWGIPQQDWRAECIFLS